MLRNDGSYEIYTIQHRYNKREPWGFSGDAMFANVPAEYRFEKGREKRARSPFKEFLSSGDCWQTTSIHGTFDLNVAMKMLELVARYNGRHSFRVVLLRLSQTTIEIAKMSISE